MTSKRWQHVLKIIFFQVIVTISCPCRVLFQWITVSSFCLYSILPMKLTSQPCCSLNEVTIGLLTNSVSWMLANMMTVSSSCFWKCNWIAGCRFLYNCLPKILSEVLDTYTHPPPWELMKSVGVIKSAHHGEGDGLIICWWLRTSWLHHSGCISFDLRGTDIVAAFHVLLWSSFCNLIDLSILIIVVCCNVHRVQAGEWLQVLKVYYPRGSKGFHLIVCLS